MDSDVRVRGLASRSAVVRSAAGSTPVIGTVPATGGMGRAYGLMLRWCRIVANHPTLCTTMSGLQPRTAIAARTATAAHSLPTTHLFRAGVAQQRFDLCDLVGSRRDEDAKAIV